MPFLLFVTHPYTRRRQREGYPRSATDQGHIPILETADIRGRIPNVGDDTAEGKSPRVAGLTLNDLLTAIREAVDTEDGKEWRTLSLPCHVGVTWGEGELHCWPVKAVDLNVNGELCITLDKERDYKTELL